MEGWGGVGEVCAERRKNELAQKPLYQESSVSIGLQSDDVSIVLKARWQGERGVVEEL